MPYLIKGLLEIYENMIQALLMVKEFLAKDSKVEDMFTGAPSCSKTACSSAMICSAWGLSLLSRIFKITLLGWLMRLIVL